MYGASPPSDGLHLTIIGLAAHARCGTTLLLALLANVVAAGAALSLKPLIPRLVGVGRRGRSLASRTLLPSGLLASLPRKVVSNSCIVVLPALSALPFLSFVSYGT